VGITGGNAMTEVKLPRNVMAEKLQARQDNFYKQTIAENNARLNAHTTFDQLRNEIKFIQSQMLIDGGANP
jgi:hypothetical protein